MLAQVKPSLAELLGGRDLVLPFSGICNFRKEVVFVGLAPGQHRQTLDSLAGQLQTFSFSLCHFVLLSSFVLIDTFVHHVVFYVRLLLYFTRGYIRGC